MGKGNKKSKTGHDFNNMIGGEGSDGVEYDYEKIVHMTDSAVLLEIEGDESWIPKSQIIDASDHTVTLTKFIAKKLGWI